MNEKLKIREICLKRIFERKNGNGRVKKLNVKKTTIVYCKNTSMSDSLFSEYNFTVV